MTTITLRIDADTLDFLTLAGDVITPEVWRYGREIPRATAARLDSYLETLTDEVGREWPGAEVEVDASQIGCTGATRGSEVDYDGGSRATGLLRELEGRAMERVLREGEDTSGTPTPTAERRLTPMQIDAIPYDLTEEDDSYLTAIDHDGHSAEDCGECDECTTALESIQEALPPGWRADWTGNASGTVSDVSVYPVEDAD